MNTSVNQFQDEDSITTCNASLNSGVSNKILQGLAIGCIFCGNTFLPLGVDTNFNELLYKSIASQYPNWENMPLNFIPKTLGQEISTLWEILKPDLLSSLIPSVSVLEDARVALWAIDNGNDVFEFETIDGKFELFYYNRTKNVTWEADYLNVSEAYSKRNEYIKLIKISLSPNAQC